MPLSVRADTDTWLSESNPVEEFLSECLQYDPRSSVLSSDVYQLYKQWAINVGRRTMSDQTFWVRAKTASILLMGDVERTITRSYEGLVSGTRPVDGPQRVITCVSYTDEYRRMLVGI